MLFEQPPALGSILLPPPFFLSLFCFALSMSDHEAQMSLRVSGKYPFAWAAEV